MDPARYRELFLTEARDHLVAINQALIALEHAPATSPEGRDSLDALFRSVHTVKGMSGVMGYDAVGSLSHAMESLLGQLRSGAAAVDREHVALLFDAADALERTIEGESAPNPEGVARSALDVRALVERLKERSEAPATFAPPARLAVLSDGEGYGVHIVLDPGTLLPGARAQLVVARARTLGTVTQVVPDEASMLADDFAGSFALRLVSDRDAATIRAALAASGFVREVTVERSAPPTTEDPRAGDVARRFDAAWGSDALKAPLQRFVRIDLRRLDHLMQVVGELMIVRGQLAQRAAVLGDGPLDEAVGEASRLVAALQEGVLGSRMVPVWQVFDRFPRVVRDAARSLGKEVEFAVEGREIELDRALLEQIADPLVHLLRNAVDHGIEGPDERLRAGKGPTGRLTVSATRERSAVLVQVRDDGRGVDRARILAKAKALGWVDDERETLDDDEVLRVIARPGFSTADRVTQLSGRGVGIDAVIQRVRSLGGTVDLRSADGKGTTFVLRLPVTLAVIPALLARVADETYALPLTHVTETLQLSRGVIRSVRGREVIVLRGEVLPLLRLRTVVGLAALATDGASTGGHVLVLQVAERRAGLVVDHLIGQDEIVVKPIDAVRGAASFVNGATIMGDGAPALILEVSSLLQGSSQGSE